MEILENDVFRGCLFAVIGIIVLASLLLHRLRRARYTEKVTAIITHNCCGGSKGAYQPVYEYHVEGANHRVASRWGHRSRIIEDGAEVELYYIPDRPEKIYVPIEAKTFLIYKIFFLFFGLASFVLGTGLALGLIDG